MQLQQGSCGNTLILVDYARVCPDAKVHRQPTTARSVVSDPASASLA